MPARHSTGTAKKNVPVLNATPGNECDQKLNVYWILIEVFN